MAHPFGTRAAARPTARGRGSLLRTGAPARLAAALVLSVLLWGAILWAAT